MAPKDTDSVDLPLSSFPALAKPPTDRNVPFRNALEWLEGKLRFKRTINFLFRTTFIRVSNFASYFLGKRKDDNIDPNLWRVYDRLYDLNDFIDKHPGGSDWLKITRGMDITESFEASHVVNPEIVNQTLLKYYVEDATHPRYSPYSFEKNGFFKTLKKRIQPVLKEVGSSPTLQIRLIQDGMVAALIITSLLGIYLNSIWLQLLAGFILSITVIGSHNFFHIRDNWRKYYFDLSLLSHHEWRVSHAISHHLFPNTVLVRILMSCSCFLEYNDGIYIFRTFCRMLKFQCLNHYLCFYQQNLKLGSIVMVHIFIPT